MRYRRGMALVKCKSCGKDVDSIAKACPGCGAQTTGHAMLVLVSAAITGALIWYFWLRHFW